MASPSSKHLHAAREWLRARPARMVGVSLFVAALLLRSVAPVLLDRIVEARASALLDRRVEVGDVDLALLAGGVGLHRIYVGPSLGGEPATEPLDPGEVRFGARRVDINVSWLSLLVGELTIDAVRVDTPRVLHLRDAAGHLPPLLRAASNAQPSDAGEGPGASFALRELSIVNANFSYLDLSEPDRQPFEVGIADLELTGLELSDGMLEIASIAIREPSVRVLKDFDASALEADEEVAGEPPADAEPSVDTAPPPPLSFHIGEVTLSDARLAVLGESGGDELDTSLEARATDIDLEPGTRFPIEITLEIESGRVHAQGEAGLQPLLFDGGVEWQTLPLADIARAAGARFPGHLSSGSSSGEIRVVFADDAAGKLAISGRTEVTDFAASNAEGVDVAWSALVAEIESIDLDGSGARGTTLSLKSLELRKPAISVVMSASAADSPPSSEARAGPGPRIRIAQLDVSEGSFVFEDTHVTPPHRTEVRDFAVRGTGLRWPERQASSLEIEARSSDETALTVTGALGDEHAGVDLALSGLSLPAFSPYIADAAGYWVDRGHADLEAKVRHRGNTTHIDSALVLRRLAVTSVAPGTFAKRYGVSLDAALALLRDSSGEIRVPIQFKLEGTTSRLDTSAIVFVSLRQALVGALTSPLKGLGLLLSSDEEDGGVALAPIAFERRSVTLSADADLMPLAELLALRPGLGLRVRGSVASEDALGVAELVLIAKIVADEEPPELAAAVFQRRRIWSALEARAAGEPGELDAEDRAVLDVWLASVETDEDDRAAFALARAEAVRRALLALPEVDEHHVSIGDGVEGDPGVVLELAPIDR